MKMPRTAEPPHGERVRVRGFWYPGPLPLGVFVPRQIRGKRARLTAREQWCRPLMIRRLVIRSVTARRGLAKGYQSLVQGTPLRLADGT